MTEAGWLYAVRGRPEPDDLDASGYIALLTETITRMAAEEHREGNVEIRMSKAKSRPKSQS